MKRIGWIVGGVVFIALFGVVLALFLPKSGGREYSEETAKSSATVSAVKTAVKAPDSSPRVSRVPNPALAEGSPITAITPTIEIESSPAQPSSASSKGPRSPKPPIQDPDARAALALVGIDSDAEAYWMDAINDSSLPPSERKDLIEDLNEDGLSDPKHPSPEDLPVILNRIAMIEELTPSAMDQVNFEAFAEAYKDLVNLANLATGGGKPVK